MSRRHPGSGPLYSSAASDVDKRQRQVRVRGADAAHGAADEDRLVHRDEHRAGGILSLITISEPTRLRGIAYAAFSLNNKSHKSTFLVYVD